MKHFRTGRRVLTAEVAGVWISYGRRSNGGGDWKLKHERGIVCYFLIFAEIEEH